jgi:hypothetical protein
VVAAAGVLAGLGTDDALAQSYQVSVAESGVAYPTTYTKRYNWRYYGDLRHTTMVASDSDPKACGESACLDDGEPGDRGPDGTRGGTASSNVTGMAPGRYQIEMKCRRSDNRATSVAWSASTDAAINNSRQGNLDQRNDPAISTATAGSWIVLGATDLSPVDVQGTLSFSFGAASGLNGSLSYGGVRLTKVGDPTPHDGGVADTGGPAGACAAIRTTVGFELCVETETTCAGVFTNGAGCAAYCAAAEMVCTAAFGASPGCNKEPQNPLSCAATNGHNSDWCECTYPPGYDAGADAGTPDAGWLDAGEDTAAPDASDLPDLSDPSDASDGSDTADAGTFDANVLSDVSSVPAPDRSDPSNPSDRPQSGAEPFEYDALGCGCATMGMD